MAAFGKLARAFLSIPGGWPSNRMTAFLWVKTGTTRSTPKNLSNVEDPLEIIQGVFSFKEAFKNRNHGQPVENPRIGKSWGKSMIWKWKFRPDFKIKFA